MGGDASNGLFAVVAGWLDSGEGLPRALSFVVMGLFFGLFVDITCAVALGNAINIFRSCCQ